MPSRGRNPLFLFHSPIALRVLEQPLPDTSLSSPVSGSPDYQVRLRALRLSCSSYSSRYISPLFSTSLQISETASRLAFHQVPGSGKDQQDEGHNADQGPG